MDALYYDCPHCKLEDIEVELEPSDSGGGLYPVDCPNCYKQSFLEYSFKEASVDTVWALRENYETRVKKRHDMAFRAIEDAYDVESALVSLLTARMLLEGEYEATDKAVKLTEIKIKNLLKL